LESIRTATIATTQAALKISEVISHSQLSSLSGIPPFSSTTAYLCDRLYEPLGSRVLQVMSGVIHD
jgi:hypothetical protein